MGVKGRQVPDVSRGTLTPVPRPPFSLAHAADGGSQRVHSSQRGLVSPRMPGTSAERDPSHPPPEREDPEPSGLGVPAPALRLPAPQPSRMAGCPPAESPGQGQSVLAVTACRLLCCLQGGVPDSMSPPVTDEEGEPQRGGLGQTENLAPVFCPPSPVHSRPLPHSRCACGSYTVLEVVLVSPAPWPQPKQHSLQSRFPIKDGNTKWHRNPCKQKDSI